MKKNSARRRKRKKAPKPKTSYLEVWPEDGKVVELFPTPEAEAEIDRVAREWDRHHVDHEGPCPICDKVKELEARGLIIRIEHQLS